MWIIDILERLCYEYKEGEFNGSIRLDADLLYTIENYQEFKEHKNDTICSNDILEIFKRYMMK